MELQTTARSEPKRKLRSSVKRKSDNIEGNETHSVNKGKYTAKKGGEVGNLTNESSWKLLKLFF